MKNIDQDKFNRLYDEYKRATEERQRRDHELFMKERRAKYARKKRKKRPWAFDIHLVLWLFKLGSLSFFFVLLAFQVFALLFIYRRYIDSLPEVWAKSKLKAIFNIIKFILCFCALCGFFFIYSLSLQYLVEHYGESVLWKY